MDLTRIARVLALAALIVGAVALGVSIARDGLPGHALGWTAVAIGLSVWVGTAEKPPRDADEPGA
ncbi:hypothetical protein [Rubrivirga sp. IMCC45206]|uniref:hypothetical protein n=1 Tax=Rubrivirga sp. IMCC45206 TaxID=3391614 RepID=UPI00398F96DD